MTACDFSCDTLTATFVGAANIDSYSSVLINSKADLIGRGNLETGDKEKFCSAKKLIDTAVGSGPLYDITLTEDFSKDFWDRFDEGEDQEAIIERTRTSKYPEIARFSLGDEDFWISPSLMTQGYERIASPSNQPIDFSKVGASVLDSSQLLNSIIESSILERTKFSNIFEKDKDFFQARKFSKLSGDGKLLFTFSFAVEAIEHVYAKKVPINDGPFRFKYEYYDREPTLQESAPDDNWYVRVNFAPEVLIYNTIDGTLRDRVIIKTDESETNEFFTIILKLNCYSNNGQLYWGELSAAESIPIDGPKNRNPFFLFTRYSEFSSDQEDYNRANLAVSYDGKTFIAFSKVYRFFTASEFSLALGPSDPLSLGDGAYYRIDNGELLPRTVTLFNGKNTLDYGHFVSISDDGDTIAYSEPTIELESDQRYGNVRVFRLDNSTDIENVILSHTWSQLGSDFIDIDPALNGARRINLENINAVGHRIALSSDGERLALTYLQPPSSFARLAVPSVRVYDYTTDWQINYSKNPTPKPYIDSREFDARDIMFNCIDMDFSKDGTTIALGCPANNNSRRQGQVFIFKEGYEDNFIVDPENNFENSISDSILFGQFVRLSSDGNTIAVAQTNSVSLYEFRDTTFIGPNIDQNRGSSNIIINDNDVPGQVFAAEEELFIANSVQNIYGTFAFEKISNNVWEDSGLVELTIIREGGSEGVVDIDYETFSDTASYYQDFQRQAGTLRFQDGETSKKIYIEIIEDYEIEGTETLTVELSNAILIEGDEDDTELPYFVVGQQSAYWKKVHQIDIAYGPQYDLSHYSDHMGEIAYTDISIDSLGEYLTTTRESVRLIDSTVSSNPGFAVSFGDLFKINRKSHSKGLDRDITNNTIVDWYDGYISYTRSSTPTKKFSDTTDHDDMLDIHKPYKYFGLGAKSLIPYDSSLWWSYDIFRAANFSFPSANYSVSLFINVSEILSVLTLGDSEKIFTVQNDFGIGGLELYIKSSDTPLNPINPPIEGAKYLEFILNSNDISKEIKTDIRIDDQVDVRIRDKDPHFRIRNNYENGWVHLQFGEMLWYIKDEWDDTKWIFENGEWRKLLIPMYTQGKQFTAKVNDVLCADKTYFSYHERATDPLDRTENEKELDLWIESKTQTYRSNVITFHGYEGALFDDLRFYSRQLEKNEISLLCNHRIKTTFDDKFYYDVLKRENGVITLEYRKSSFTDISISTFGDYDTTIIPGEEDPCHGPGEPTINTEFIIDAEVKFCYYTNLPNITPVFGLSAFNIGGSGFLETNSPPNVGQIHSESREIIGEGRLFSAGIFGYTLSSHMSGVANIQTGFVDKYNGDFYDLSCTQILYPSSDINVSDFRSPNSSPNIYLEIDEGVYEGDWRTDSTLISDDKNSYIQLISPDTKGEFSFSCGMTNTLFDPEESIIKFRMSGPLRTIDSDIPPRYTIKNIKLNDPNGELISQYEDIQFIGDSKSYRDVNYTTFVRSEKINNVKNRYKWGENYPVLDSGNGYSLSFDVTAEDFGGEFTQGFNDDYREDLFGNYPLNPSLRISAIEICTSGRPSTYDEDFIKLLMPVADTGRRIEKCFHPTFFPKFDFDTGVWPSVSSVWQANGDSSLSNESTRGSMELLTSIRDGEDTTYATLSSMGPVEDSGKLTIRFGYDPASKSQIEAGPFDDAFGDGRIRRDNIWFSPRGAFAGLTNTEEDIDFNYFEFESITLKVRAKKAVGTRDYVLDVVGYSDDCLLNVTPAVGGFLQNTSGVYLPDHSTDTLVFYGNEGTVPTSSGFKGVDDLGLSSEPFSNKDEYFEVDTTNNPGGDHYLLTTYPVVSSTEFDWYEIPLKVFDDNVELGASRKYNISSMLERLYLDIYPLPTGATISSIHLCVRYAPQNAFNLMSQGGEKILRSNQNVFYPTSRQTNDTIINAGSGFAPLSQITNIPHGFSTPTDIKSNYSRRWKGREGTVNGPFDVDQFNFGFENPLMDYPFVSGYYLFENNSTDILPVDGGITGTLTTTYADYHYTNWGWRFSNNQLFEDRWPTFSTSYTTTDWTALEDGVDNFQDHELYGKIADAFKNVVRISGHNSYINFGDLDMGTQGENGLSIFLRFTPDANVSGADYNMFESGVLVSKWDAGQDLEFCLAYSGGYLTARATDAISSNVIEIYDTVPYSGYQFPLSIILTYNDHESQRMKLYTDNEFEADWNVLRATSNPFYLSVGNSDLKVGHSPGSGVGFNMFVSEFGISSGNIVESNPDATYQQVTAQKFFENNRVYWWENNDDASTDAYKLWSYVDESTRKDWYIGAFKSCEFNYEYDALNSIKGKRTNRDLINFTINHHGSGYSQLASLDMPTSVNSGVSYHTQIENDFLRLHLTDTEENFYSIYTRISKNLPYGYNFAENALFVETIIDHKSDSHNIEWEDGNIGPKLIVSLYTKSKEAKHPTVEPFTEPNWGLINRSIHYLPPSSCLTRLDSKFTYGDYCHEGEEWALYPNFTAITEFTEKYFSTHVDDMFLQYDLVYPSGPAFDSRVDIHSCHVRTEDAFVYPLSNSGDFLLTTSGNPSPVENSFDLCLMSASGIESSGLPFNITAPIDIHESGLFIVTIGEDISVGNMPLVAKAHRSIEDQGFVLVASGDGRTWTGIEGGGNKQDDNNGDNNGDGVVGGMVVGDLVVGANNPPFPFFIYGRDTMSATFTMTIGEDQSGVAPDQPILPLNIFAASGASGINDNMPIFMLQDYSDNNDNPSGNLNLLMIGRAKFSNRFRNVSMPLSIEGPDPPPPSENMNLSIRVREKQDATVTGGMNLYTADFTGFNLNYFLWYNNHYGVPIDFEDNRVASIPIDDEIRGVDLYGYGSCTGDSPRKAIEPAIVTDDTVWFPAICHEGGIFRATSTYTNLDVGYEGDYYGIRKFQGLIPNAPYLVELTIKTGSTDPIDLPRDWEEWEYGTCGPDTIGDCCPDDACTRNINFSGIKLIGDYPYLSGDPQITEPDGRNAGDKYGYSVAVKKDLMAVGAPYHEFENEEGNNMHKAGAVFLYRRNEDIPGLKAEWELQDKIVLPSGFRGDYVSRTYAEFIKYDNFSISGQQWNIGMEGREFGHCVDLASSGDRETLVVGAPGAYWNREFRDITVSGIPVLMMVFTDKFAYDKDKIRSIGITSLKYDTLYKYFSAPWVFGGSEFQPELDINLLICQIHDGDQIDELPPVKSPYSWFKHVYINNINDTTVDTRENLTLQGLEDVKAKFLDFFPYVDALYSGIPPIVGVFGDNTASSAGGFEPIIDRFLEFYQDYAYTSGVKDLTNNTAQSGYIKQVYGDSFGWDNDTIKLLDQTLATGNLLNAKQVRFPEYKFSGNPVMNYISSGIGQQYAIQDAYEFQVPPESGGRVYIFEKEGGKFNLVQEIVSPEEEITIDTDNPAQSTAGEDGEAIISPYRPKPNDRFGHSVAISNNSEVVAIGSPYSSESCLIYERDETENTRMYEKVRAWLIENNKTELINKYNTLATASGAYEVQKQVYLEMTQSDKFLFRTDRNFWGATPINLYKKIYKYDNTDIRYVGTWRFISNEVAGTSRLGYSAAVSEDGGIVAFGAPTDSFNEFDDTNLYYRQEDTWASYVNAGAVRVFESRRSYKHNKAVEYTRFGNLDRAVHATGNLEKQYDQMSGIFAKDNIPFERLPFEEIEIPKDAGLAFIITPEIDAASDEIIDNLKSWLALGDRTLVIVGNDPVWEDNGLYAKSNRISNKILQKLGSRMKLVPARNQHEALIDGVTEDRFNNDKYNIVPAPILEYTHDTHVQSPLMFASGVADIKIDLSDLGLEDLLIYSPCDDDNTKCLPPLKHMGDLRTQWNSKCLILGADPPAVVEYNTNWAWHFNNDNPAMQCSFYPQILKPLIDRPNEEIRPIAVAADYVTLPPIIIEAQSGVNRKCESILSGIRETKITNNTITYDFEDDQIDEVAFSIGQFDDGILTGKYNFFDKGTFSDPSPYRNRDAILQGVGTSWLEDVAPDLVVVEKQSIWATEEQYFDGVAATSSKVIIMASLQAETDFSLGKGEQNEDPNNKDQNIFFYNNLAMKDCNNAGNILQLGGWTGRESFKDAFKDSGLAKIFTQYGHALSMNVVFNQGDTIANLHNLVWIANPAGTPSDEDITRIKNWLNTGNKKLVITYGQDQEIVGNVDYICDKLGLKTKPYYSNTRNEYYIQGQTQLITNGNQQSIPYDRDNPDLEIIQKLDDDADVFVGCEKGQKFNQLSAFNTRVEKLAIIAAGSDTRTFEPPGDPDNEYGNELAFFPLKLGENTRELVKYDIPITELQFNNPHEYWKIDAIGSVDFPVQAGSGYRIFMNYVSESLDEKYDITFEDNGIYYNPNPPGVGEDESRSQIDKKFKVTTPGKPKTLILNFRVKSDTSSASFIFNTDEWKKIPSADLNGGKPLTPRIISISGCLLPIRETLETTTKIKKEKIFIEKCVDEPWFIPGQVIEQEPKFGAISTINDKYCSPFSNCLEEGFGGQLVEDGPVVVADEYEHFTTFDVGRKRSRIVLISDSTMIQGQSPYLRSDAKNENQLFIRSLYPPSPDNNSAFGLSNELSYNNAIRRFSFAQKVIAPQRGSAAKYYAASGLQLLTTRYGGNGSLGNLDKYTDQENSQNPGDVFRENTPVKKEERETALELAGIHFLSTYGVFPRYSGIIDGTLYVDAPIEGGLPDFMLAHDYKDYIDFDMLASGFAGDLFGYSIDIHEDKLIVGAPFQGFLNEEIDSWSDIYNMYESGGIGSGLQLSSEGGAGAAFYYERTGRGKNAVTEFLPWEFKQKIRPSSINVGIDNCTLTQLRDERAHEPVNLPSLFVYENASRTDRFGHSVAIDSDFAVIGAPMHDFETIHQHIYGGTAAFIRKEFDLGFDIPKHNFFDLGSSGVRIDDFGTDSGKFVLNNGAAFTFRHKMVDWASRGKKWVYAQKMNAEGYSDRNTNLSIIDGCENDYFGFSVAIDRARRGDSDYVMVAGSPNHDYPTSGEHPTQVLEDAGASYTFDAMLREQGTVFPNAGNYIDAKTFGAIGESASVRSKVYQNVNGDPEDHVESGIIFADPYGNIFLEVSGKDAAEKGFVAHRPYVESIEGRLFIGTQNTGQFNLITDGEPNYLNDSQNLSIVGPSSDIVYNNVNLFSFGSYVVSGDMPLYAEAPSGASNNSLNLNLGVDQVANSMNLRIRGK